MEEKNLTENQNNGTIDKKNFFADMFDWMCSIFSAILCFIVIFALLARVITVDGESMVPTLQDQQRLIVSDMFYTTVEKVEVVREGKVRRAKLYYLRDRVGKAAKVKSKI